MYLKKTFLAFLCLSFSYSLGKNFSLKIEKKANNFDLKIEKNANNQKTLILENHQHHKNLGLAIQCYNNPLMNWMNMSIRSKTSDILETLDIQGKKEIDSILSKSNQKTLCDIAIGSNLFEGYSGVTNTSTPKGYYQKYKEYPANFYCIKNGELFNSSCFTLSKK